MELINLQGWSTNQLINAGNNWHARKMKLLSAYCKKNAFDKRRICKLIDLLEIRFNEAYERYAYKKMLLKKQQHDFDHQLILLSCHNFECKESIAVMMKDYKPGEHLCPTCNNILRSDYDDDLDDMLFEIGFRTGLK
jgi:hypothetical protein